MKDETVSKSFSIPLEVWQKIEELRFSMKFKTMTDLVTIAINEYLKEIEEKGR